MRASRAVGSVLEVGLVVDTHQIFRRSYIPTTIDFSFVDYPRFDTTLDVDPLSGLVTLRIHNLSQEEKDAFSDAVATSITVLDDGHRGQCVRGPSARRRRRGLGGGMCTAPVFDYCSIRRQVVL